MPTQIYKNKEGKRLPSVTTIISGQSGWNKNILLRWYSKEYEAGRNPNDKKEAAADTGTLCHHFIECKEQDISRDQLLIDKATTKDLLIAEQCLEYYLELKESEGIEIDNSMVEKALVSENYQFAGCIDLAGKVKFKKSLIDAKTSNSIYGEHVVQLGGYDILLEENNYPVDDHYFLKIAKELPEDPVPENIIKLIKVPEDVIDVGRKIFLMYRELYDLQKQIDFDYPGKKQYKPRSTT